MPTPPCSAPRRSRADRSASSRRRWISRSATAARCIRICRTRSRTANCRCTISRRRRPARMTSRCYRLRGAGALESPDARLCSAGRFHSAGRGKRPDRRDGRMDSARGMPRGRVMAEAAADRGQPVAGAVPARRSRRRWCIRSCSRPALRPAGWSSRSPKAC